MVYEEILEPVYEMLRGSVIRGVAFSIYNQFGPQNLFAFPPPIEHGIDGFGPTQDQSIQLKINKYKEIIDSEFESSEQEKGEKKNGISTESRLIIQEFSERDYIQVAVKSLSILLGETMSEKDFSYFGVLPYPDFDVSAFTFFKTYLLDPSCEITHDRLSMPTICTFSLLVDYNKRQYIYDNINFLKKVIIDTTNALIVFVRNNKWKVDDTDPDIIKYVHSTFFDFFSKLKLAEGSHFNKSLIPQKQVKIIFTGLRSSGKNSFLLTINRKYSKLIKRDSSDTAGIHVANLLGTTLINWDIGEDSFRDFKVKANAYLNDANLIYYFIDATDFENKEKSTQWFTKILQYLKFVNLDIPVIIIISQVDRDLADKPEIRERISDIKTKISATALDYMKNFKFFETSIFDFTSVLRAFSNGIAIMIPGKEIADRKLQEYSKLLNAQAIILFNENGLILSEFAVDPEFDIKHEFPLKYVFESLSPDYLKIFKTLESESEKESLISGDLILKTKLMDGHLILLKKITISDLSDGHFHIYMLICVDDPVSRQDQFNHYLKRLEQDFIQIYGKL
ncbi:MAG: ADP-ribosylation factor-like protein [Promethearchaeota archaeon]